MASSSDCSGEISFFSGLFLGIFNGVSGSAAIIGNTMVLITFFKNQCLRQPTYYLMASLAAMDFLVGLVVNPFYIVLTNFVTWQYREENLLQLESFLDMTSSMTIMYTLTCMSIERYIAVIYSLRYRSVVTGKRSLIAIAVVWFFGFSLNALYFVTNNDNLPKMWVTCGVITGIAMTIILACYAKIFSAARAQSRRIAVSERCAQSNSTSTQTEEKPDPAVAKRAAKEAKRARKAAWRVGVTVGAVMFLSLPVFVVGIIQVVIMGDLCRFRYYNQVWMWSTTLSLISSALDPWIYAMGIKEFRDCFKRTIRDNLLKWVQMLSCRGQVELTNNFQD